MLEFIGEKKTYGEYGLYGHSASTVLLDEVRSATTHFSQPNSTSLAQCVL